LTGTGCDMMAIVRVLADETGKPVVDRTGLQGRFDLKLDWTPEPPPIAAAPGAQPVAPNPLDLSGPTIFTAVQQQLGLKLEARKAPVPVLVIEHAEKPSVN
ncbi:MAG: TIGR03435 family protein, partial [Acidobacteriota bacterium]|nr:TIGR03435 family protein [Acidobacteriota bacterium]